MGIAYLKWFKENQSKVILDPISNICILGAFMLFVVDMFVFLPDASEPEIMKIVLRSAISFAFLLGGLIGMLFSGVHVPRPQTKGGDIDLSLSTTETALITILFMINMMAIVTINIITQQYSKLWTQSFVNYPDSLLRWMIYSTAIGWTEEVVIRGFFQVWMTKLSGGIIGVLASTGAWVLFHGGVYNLDPQIYLLLFLIGVILSTTFHIAKYRLSVTMLPHGLNNFVSVSRSGAIALGLLDMDNFVKYTDRFNAIIEVIPLEENMENELEKLREIRQPV